MPTGRDKCDGKKPCLTCQANSRTCGYNTNPKKRGIQPGYIRALELCLAALLHGEVDLKPRLQGYLKNSASPLRQAIGYKGTGSSDELYSKWTDGIFPKLIDNILTGADDGFVDSIAVSDLDNNYISPPLPAMLILPDNFWNLLDRYYTYTHNWLPISDKQQVLKAAYEYPTSEETIRKAANSACHAELWAILSLTIQQSTHSSEQSMGQGLGNGHPQPLNHTANLAQSQAYRFLDDPVRMEEGSIRALLIIGLRNLVDKRISIARYNIASAAVHITLIPDFQTNPIKHSRLLAGCFVLDSIVSGLCGTPSLINWESMGGQRRLAEDGLEEWTPWNQVTESGASRLPGRCLSIFTALVHACQGLTSKTLFIGMTPPSGRYPNSATPQAAHLCIMHDWVRHMTGRMSIDEFKQSATSELANFDTWGSRDAIPPTLQLLLNRFKIPLDAKQHQVIPQGNIARHSISSLGTELPLYSAQTPITTLDMTDMTAHTMPAQPPTPNQHFGQFLPQHLSTSNWNDGSPEAARTTMMNQTAFSIPASDPDAASAVSEGDARMSDFEALFEEIAQLDQTRQTTEDVQFMQNLGLGPDSDLRAFFGKDYRISDPIYTYLQLDEHTQNNPGGPSDFPT